MYTADKLIAGLFIGASALVATTLISPLMFFIAALSSFFISGLGAYVGLLIGKEKSAKASSVSSGILILMGLMGIVMTIPSIIYTEEIALFLGAREEFLTLSMDYIKFFSLSFPLLLLGKGLDVLILNDGSPRYSFILNIVTTVSNLLLNIIAVALLGWGIKGLAIATVISSGIELLGGSWYFIYKSKLIKLSTPTFHLLTFLRIAYNGISDFAMMIVEAVMVYVINIAFVRYLTPQHFEAYAAVSIIIILFYSIYMGATMGLQPILSQMMGRGEFKPLKSLLNYSVKKTLIYGGIAYVLLLPFVKTILRLFIDEPLTLDYGLYFYITLGAATLLSNYPLQVSIFFTAINRPLESALISILRTLIIIPPLVFILIILIGAGGIALGFAIADLIIIGGIMMYMKRIDLSKLKVYD
jgi:Na+-driven multidrug efflux pump